MCIVRSGFEGTLKVAGVLCVRYRSVFSLEPAHVTIKSSEQEPENAETDKLMMSLGYVMLHWSLLERAVLDDIRRLRKVDGDNETSVRARGSFSERLAEWRALVSLKSRRNPAAATEVGEIASQAERLRRMRNLIAHHFTGAEETESGERQVLVSEGGISSLRASQTAFSTAQLDTLISEMRVARLRILGLKDVLSS